MMIVLAPDVPEDELDPSIDTIEDYVTRNEGEVIAISRDSPWGRRRLAYPIRHAGRDVRDGFYALYYFDADPSAIVQIEREIRLNDRIIRHMIIALEEQVTILPPVEPEEGAEGAEAPAGDEAATTAEATSEVEETAEAAPDTDGPASEVSQADESAEAVAEAEQNDDAAEEGAETDDSTKE
jgi:small subunit ribosomal protein S6